MWSGNDSLLELSGLIPKAADVRSVLSRSVHTADILRRLSKVAEASEFVEEQLHVAAEESLLPNQIEAPECLDEVPRSEWPVHELVVCKNKIIHLASLFASKPYTVAPIPALFTLSALDFKFVEAGDCPRPDRWLQFLNELWGDDPESIEARQLWFGLCLTPDIRLHKMLELFGPKRSGKTTIGQVQRSLAGKDNVADPTLSSLAGQFGLWPLIGRSLAIIGDARPSGRTDAASRRSHSIVITAIS